MIFAYDTEFIENGHTIDLISIAVVREDGREYYAVVSDAPWGRISHNPWLCAHVVPSLPLIGTVSRPWSNRRPARFTLDRSDARVKPRHAIADEVRDFLLAEGPPALWADYGAYDHVVLCQLWGRMVDLPTGIPMHTFDLQHEAHTRGWTIPPQRAGAHNALDDARHVMDVLRTWKKAALFSNPLP